MNYCHLTSFILIAAATMLTSCKTAQDISTSAYDERPENRQPVLERPAWPNYDLHDDRSFAAFSHIQTKPADQPMHHLRCEDGSITQGSIVLYRCKDATYLCYDWQVPTEQDWFFWRMTSGSAIIDADTGDRYLIQSHVHFPLDQCFWIYGQSGETIRLVSKYPPLPLSVKRVQIYEASGEPRRWLTGTGYITEPVDVEELRPHAKAKNLRSKTSGRIIL